MSVKRCPPFRRCPGHNGVNRPESPETPPLGRVGVALCQVVRRRGHSSLRRCPAAILWLMVLWDRLVRALGVGIVELDLSMIAARRAALAICCSGGCSSRNSCYRPRIQFKGVHMADLAKLAEARRPDHRRRNRLRGKSSGSSDVSVVLLAWSAQGFVAGPKVWAAPPTGAPLTPQGRFASPMAFGHP